MKKLLLILMALFVWAGSSFGQYAIIGTGTSTTNGSTADPIQQYYNYTHFQIVYTAAELTAAGMPSGATITGLGFSVSEVPAGGSLANFTIDMGHTTQATASPYISTGLSNVVSPFTYNLVLQTAGNFDMIGFTSNFVWDGTSNIVVNTCTGSNPYTSPYGGLRYTSATSGAARYIQTDGSSNCGVATGTNSTYRPNIRFDYTSTSPALNVAPGSLAFGYVPSGNVSELSYALSGLNLTAGPVVVTAPAGFGVSLTTGGPYTASVNVSYTAPALTSTPIFVQFAPTGPGASYSGNITNVGGGASANVAVSGSSDIFSLYCTSGASSSGDEDITLVQFGSSLNNTSPCASLIGSQGTATGTANLYSNFTSITPTDIVQGMPVPISVEITECAGSAYSHSVRVYIDFNQNGLLTDAGEETIIWAYASSNTHTINANINVPPGATLGNTLMRVVCKESSTTGPCLVSSWGETEDYKVNIVAGSTSTLTWYNLQWPDFATIEVLQNTTVYAQCWESGVTDVPGPGAGIVCWIGYSSTDTDPSTWIHWVPAIFNVDVGDNDEYKADLGFAQGLAPGTYYYASRFSYLNGPFTYGGYPNGAWNGTTQVSGVLTVTPVPNDDCSGAISLTVGCDLSYTTGSNVSATNSGLTPGCASFLGGDVWYSAVVPDDGYLVVETAVNGGITDGGMAAWTGTCGSLSLYECDDDDGPGLMSLIEINDMTLAGQTVYFSVWEYGNNVFGSFDIGAHNSPLNAIWTGAISNDWHDAGNWNTYCYPGVRTNVVIPTGLTNYPTLTAAGYCNNITVKSDATGDASLVDNGNLTSYGTTTVERYLTAESFGGNDNWHFVSPSVTGATADMFHLSASTGLNVYLQSFNEATNAYTDLVSGSLYNTEGYAVWVDGNNATPPVTDWVFSATGYLNTGSFGSADNLYRSNTGDNGGNNLMGNPYACSIDWDASSGWTKTNVMNSTYIEKAGNWATYVTGSGGTNGGTQYIAMGQGFFVFVNDDGSTFGTLSMDPAVQVHNNTAFQKSSYSDYIKLVAEGNGKTDETAIHFMQEASPLFEGQNDARKLFATEMTYPQIYTIADRDLAINAMPQVDWVQLGFSCGADGEYTISVAEINDIPSVWLEDTFTGIFTNLTNDSYSFTYSTSDAANRFILHFAPLGVDDNFVDNTNIYSYGKDVYVNVSEITNGDIVIYNLMGQKVISTSISGLLNKVTLKEGGYYVVVVRNDETVVTEKVFIK